MNFKIEIKIKQIHEENHEKNDIDGVLSAVNHWLKHQSRETSLQ